MAKILVSKENPGGYRTEDLLNLIRLDLLERMQRYVTDPRKEMKPVLNNNVEILSLLTRAVELAERNTSILDAESHH